MAYVPLCDTRSQLNLLVWPSCLANHWTLNIPCRLFNWIFPHPPCLQHLWLVVFYTNVSDLDLGWGLQDQGKAGPVEIVFLYTSQMIRMILDTVLKQLKLSFLIHFWSDDCLFKQNSCCFTDCIKKNVNFSEQLDFHELISFQPGLTLGSTELCISIPDWSTLTFHQGCRDAVGKKHASIIVQNS